MTQKHTLLAFSLGLTLVGMQPRMTAAQVPPASMPARGADVDAASLARSVGALPEDTQAARLKKAMLTWALEDAQADRAAGFADKGRATLSDVQQAISHPLGQVQAAPANLFPPIADFDHNPLAQSSVAGIKKVLAANQTYQKGAAGSAVHDEKGWHFVTVSGEGLSLTEAFCHPQSPFHGDPALVAPILRRFETAYAYLTPGSGELADFGPSPMLTLMYLNLSTVYPDLILPSKKALWEKAIQTNADAITAKNAKTYHEAVPGTAYPNSDFKYIATLAYAGLLFHRQDYTQAAEDGLRLMKTAEYPDGGFAYIGLQNENYTYHGINIGQLASLWRVTGNPLARQMLDGTRNYLPLSIEPPGVSEYSTAPSWKHYWNGGTWLENATIVAGQTGDPQNARVAVMGQPPAPTSSLPPIITPRLRPPPRPTIILFMTATFRGRADALAHSRSAAPPAPLPATTGAKIRSWAAWPCARRAPAARWTLL